MYGENRSARRVSCSARFLGAGTTTVRGDLVDLSGTGVCLATDVALEKGRELHLEFELPHGHVEAVGEIRWVEPKDGCFEVGIRFIRIPAASSAVIAQATARRGGGGWAGTLVFR